MAPSRVAENSNVWWGSCRYTSQYPLNLGHEAHVGHAVGLIEHEHIEVFDVDLSTVAEVDEPTGRGDHDVTALSEAT